MLDRNLDGYFTFRDGALHAVTVGRDRIESDD